MINKKAAMWATGLTIGLPSIAIASIYAVEWLWRAVTQIEMSAFLTVWLLTKIWLWLYDASKKDGD